MVDDSSKEPCSSNTVSCCLKQWAIAIIIVEGVAGGLDKEDEGRLKICGFHKSHQLGKCLEIGELGCRIF